MKKEDYNNSIKMNLLESFVLQFCQRPTSNLKSSLLNISCWDFTLEMENAIQKIGKGCIP